MLGVLWGVAVQQRPLQLGVPHRQAVCLGTINGRGGYNVPGFPGTSVCEWTGALAPGSSPRCARGKHERHGGAAPSKTLDAETLAALMIRARSMLTLGDIAAARLLLERAANSQDATAALLLARTYDPAVARSTRYTKRYTRSCNGARLVPQGCRLWLGGRATASHSTSELISTRRQASVHRYPRMFAAAIMMASSAVAHADQIDYTRPKAATA